MLAHIMVGTIPAYLPSTENVIVTSTKDQDEDKAASEVQAFTQEDQVVDPKK